MLSADLVDLRKQEAAKNLTFNMNPDDFGITNGAWKIKGVLQPKGITIPEGKILQFNTTRVDYTLPVGEVVGLDLYQVDQHPFHIHINPFQLTQDQPQEALGKKIGSWEKDCFKTSGDWHDTLFMPGSGGTALGVRVLMQTDFFTGPTVVHCHILEHEDDGMMVQVNFTGEEGSRYLRAYGVSKGRGSWSGRSVGFRGSAPRHSSTRRATAARRTSNTPILSHHQRARPPRRRRWVS